MMRLLQNGTNPGHGKFAGFPTIVNTCTHYRFKDTTSHHLERRYARVATDIMCSSINCVSCMSVSDMIWDVVKGSYNAGH